MTRRLRTAIGPSTRGRMMRARVGAEAICRVERRYSRVRIANIRMNREQFSVVIHPIRTSGLWNDDDPWTFGGVWDDNYLSICEDYWVSNHLSLHIRFNEDQVRGLVALASILPPGEYTDRHASVAGSYMSLRTSESRQVAAEISTRLEHISSDMFLRTDESRQVAAEIDALNERMRLITENLQSAAPISGSGEEATEDTREVACRFLDNANLTDIYYHMDCLIFSEYGAGAARPDEEAEPGPESI